MVCKAPPVRPACRCMLCLRPKRKRRSATFCSRRTFRAGCLGGERFFVAREPENPEADDDDGYVTSYAHNENTSESRFAVMDAKSPTLEIVADVKPPHRFPDGCKLSCCCNLNVVDEQLDCSIMDRFGSRPTSRDYCRSGKRGQY